MKGFIVQATHATHNERMIIKLFGRLDNGQSFCSVHEFTPYFFIEKKNLAKAKPFLKDFTTEETKLTTFDKKPVIKVSHESQTDINKIVKSLHKEEIDTFEADLKPTSRFFIDNNLLGSIDFGNEEYESSEKIDRVYYNPTIQPAASKSPLKVISLDIESDKKGDGLFCIGMSSKGYKKCFLHSKKNITIPNTVMCKDEREVLVKWKEELIKQDPDIITGWHVIDFDLAFLREKFAKHKIDFDIGRDNTNPRIKVEPGFFKSSTATVPGRQVLDALSLIKDPFIKEAPSIKTKKFTSYTLENVSQEILGAGKLLKGKGRHTEIEKLYNTDQKKLVEYNLKDCELAYDIVEKTDMVNLAVERSSLTGMQLSRITASIAAFDSLYIREARARGLASPTTRFTQREERIQGGYVMQSKPGLYHNLIVLDFKSLYPSIITTFNIDPASFVTGKAKEKTITAPNKARFENTDGILPGIIKRLHHAREKAKKEKRELASYAIKIIMNSFFGVLASPNCRYYSLDMANAITHFGQHLIKLTAKKIEEQGYPVIYSDTDSVFAESGTTEAKAEKIGVTLEKDINAFYDAHIKNEYERESFLELEFEKLYLAFMMPPIRGSKVASKKRYAGLLMKDGKEKIEVVGLEAIRGDWTVAAQEFQLALLDKIFHKQEFTTFIRSFVKDVLSGKLDDKLVYKKSLTKALDAYTKTTPPHVKAARKLPVLESKVVQYVMTEQGPEPIQAIKHKLDYEHYIQKQIKPIANTILFFFDQDFDDILKQSKQTTLF